MDDLLLAICIEKASSKPVLLVAEYLKMWQSPQCMKEAASAPLPQIQFHLTLLGPASRAGTRCYKCLFKAFDLIAAEKGRGCFVFKSLVVH